VRSNAAIYSALPERQLETWLDPLRALNPQGDPTQEILAYARRKLDMSRDFPRESRLFANEILQGAPHIGDDLSGPLKDLVDEIAEVIDGWARTGQIAEVRAHHLIFTIWSVTQHYADFETQVRAILGAEDWFDEASAHLDQMLRALLRPDP